MNPTVPSCHLCLAPLNFINHKRHEGTKNKKVMELMKKTGGEIIWECLKREGVRHIFGYPGGAILPAYDALCKYPEIHHVLVRHEQGAAHMADGYARAGGGV